MFREFARRILRGGVSEDKLHADRLAELFKTDTWVVNAIIVGSVLSGGFFAFRKLADQAVGIEILLGLLYAVLLYLPNSVRLLHERRVQLLMELYYYILIIGTPLGAVFGGRGFAVVLTVLLGIFVTAAILAGVLEIQERQRYWRKEAEAEAKGRRSG